MPKHILMLQHCRLTDLNPNLNRDKVSATYRTSIYSFQKKTSRKVIFYSLKSIPISLPLTLTMKTAVLKYVYETIQQTH